jgi:hypothetical protein
MGIHLQIPPRVKLHVKKPVPGKPIYHVVKKTDACLHLALTCTVQIQAKPDVGLPGPAVHLPDPVWSSVIHVPLPQTLPVWNLRGP